jgi:methylated-DNA-[protein]-cysteine S-methyltransferase
MKYVVVDTALGWIGLGIGERGLRLTTLPVATAREAEEEIRLQGASESARRDEAGGWPEKLRRYARGDATALDGALDLAQGTPFQQAVWRALLEIPCGETRTYKQIAERIGRPRAARAVGQAVGANPLPIVVPCHRVVAGDGLGGFGGGLAMKKRLLELERALID